MGMNLRNLSFHINFELLGTYQTRKNNLRGGQCY